MYNALTNAASKAERPLLSVNPSFLGCVVVAVLCRPTNVYMLCDVNVDRPHRK